MGKNFKNEDFTISARVAKMILPVFTQHLAERLASNPRSPRTKAAAREAFAFKLQAGTNQKLLHPMQRPSWVTHPKQSFPFFRIPKHMGNCTKMWGQMDKRNNPFQPKNVYPNLPSFDLVLVTYTYTNDNIGCH
jgi:hypothetical protein